MLLANKNAVIFGGSGAIGSACARVFAREGARVFLGARHRDRLEAAALGIRAQGGAAGLFQLDVLDSASTEKAMAAVGLEAGEIHVAVNATSFPHDQGSGLDALDLQTFMQPVTASLAALFNAAKATVPHMGKSRQGIVLTLTTPAGRAATPGHLGYSTACAGMEAFTRVLAAELGPRNIRAVCLGPHAISDAPQAGSYTAQLFAPKAQALGLTVEEWLAGGARSTMLGRLPTLEDVAETAAFLASDRARSMTACYVNLTAGMIPD